MSRVREGVAIEVVTAAGRCEYIDWKFAAQLDAIISEGGWPSR